MTKTKIFIIYYLTIDFYYTSDGYYTIKNFTNCVTKERLTLKFIIVSNVFCSSVWLIFITSIVLRYKTILKKIIASCDKTM